MKKIILICFAMMVAASSLSGCGEKRAVSPPPSQEEQPTPENETGVDAAALMTVTVAGNSYTRYATSRTIRFDTAGAYSAEAEYGNIVYGKTDYYTYSAKVAVTDCSSIDGRAGLILCQGNSVRDGSEKYVELGFLAGDGSNQAVIYLSSGQSSESFSAAKLNKPDSDRNYAVKAKYSHGRVSLWVDGVLVYNRFDLSEKVSDIRPKAGAFTKDCTAEISGISIRGDVNNEILKPEFCGMSNSHFLRIFKASTGTTPQNYKIFCRIQTSKGLLLNTDYQISKISKIVGFDDPLYFSRCFKKHVGCAPSDFRNPVNNSNALG